MDKLQQPQKGNPKGNQEDSIRNQASQWAEGQQVENGNGQEYAQYRKLLIIPLDFNSVVPTIIFKRLPRSTSRYGLVIY